ncbi:MAG: hypothetical protein H7Z40_20045 [Phycisphaerae bacterium]|nr:hypothetical protein [Gemmatimonadaceae bacterium]
MVGRAGVDGRSGLGELVQVGVAVIWGESPASHRTFHRTPHMADDAAVRAYIQQAVELIANQDYDRASAKLELADVELEDLSGDSKAAVAALIQEAQAYPGLHAGLQWVEEIDLNVVGQQIGFVADNLMGYRFTPDGSYYFATTIRGQPVAAQFDAALKAGIAATEEAIGRSLGDDDNNGRWEMVAVVTDKKAKLMARRSAESSGSIGSLDVSMSHEYHEPVEAVVIEILAVKCGPFAGAKGRGVLRPDGTIGM